MTLTALVVVRDDYLKGNFAIDDQEEWDPLAERFAKEHERFLQENNPSVAGWVALLGQDETCLPATVL